jgi:endoglucanase
MNAMTRRKFLQTTSTCAVALAAASPLTLRAATESPTAKRLPRWRGFNLLEKFIARGESNPPFRKSDFELMAEWGFDFARLPMSYLCWASHEEPMKLREAELKHVDEAVEFGRIHGVHVNLNLHRAPGYCVNPPKEPFDLWKDDKALEAAAFHWGHFAKRYKGIPNERVSFDLLNEPAGVTEETYVRVVKRMVEAIRAEDPGRLIIADGLQWGREPVHGLVELGLAQSTRGYDPMHISHYQASWVNGSDRWSEPTWPLKQSDRVTDKAALRRERIEPWKKLEAKGVGIHVGEWGAHNRTPHKVVLAWMRDFLELWKEAGWGWALWNLRGSFGVADSNRKDVQYEDFRGLKLDREMLKVLQAG